VKDHVRDAAISAGVGVLVAYLVTIDSTHPGPKWSVVRYGALLGVFAYVFCSGLTHLFRRWLDRLPVPGWLSRAALYFVGGAAAFLLANFVVAEMGWVRFRSTFEALRAYVPVAGAIGVLVGLIFYTFGLLQQRLLKSVERLKEAEFAEKELELARAIQQRILPPGEISADGYHIVARNLPARFVAGDFYDVFNLPDGGVVVVVADVAGKGIGASLIMATVKATLPFLAAGRPVEETLREASRRLAPRLGKREFVALVLARYEPDTGRVHARQRGSAGSLRRAGGRQRCRRSSVPGARFPLGRPRDVVYSATSGGSRRATGSFSSATGLPAAARPGGDPLATRVGEAVAGAASLDG
jgi:hypothetical protein